MPWRISASASTLKLAKSRTRQAGCSRRLEAQSGEMRVAGGDIRWIRDDEIEALALEGCEPAAMAPIDFCAECCGVTLRDLERCGARFHGDDAHSRPVLFESECNRAATRAQI